MSRLFLGKQIFICSAILFAATGWQAAWSQDPFGSDDPFGDASGGGDPFGSSADGDMSGDAFGSSVFGADAAAAPTGGAPLAELPQEDPDPIVRLIRSSPPQTPQQWADALTWVVRIKRWDEAQRLLEQLRQANWSLQQQATLARAGGSTLWMRLRVDEARLTPEQLQLVRDIMAAPGKLARDANTIETAIQKLASSSAIERRRAQLQLQDGGLQAILRLANHLLAGDTQATPAVIATTIHEFGPDGVDALRAACLVRDRQAAGRVYAGLAELQFQSYSVELGSAIAGSLLSEADRASLISTLSRRLESLPDSQAVQSFLAKRFASALEDYQQRRSSPARFGTWVWRPTPNGNSIEVVEATQREHKLERAAQIAAHRMLLRSADVDALTDSGVVLLQRAYQLDPNLAVGEISKFMLTEFEPTLMVSSEYWQQVFERADTLQMHGAALRALQLMSERAVQGEIEAPLQLLTKLLRDSRPIIRYSALAAIAKLDPKTAFGGEELAVETAVEMVGLGAGPLALVIGHHADLRMTAADLLAQLTGQQAMAVGTGRAALQELSGNQPIEMIVVADRVSDISLFQLLQRLRNTRQGQSLPIAIMTEQLYPHERQLVETTPGVITGTLTRNVEQSRQILASLWKQLDTNPLSTEERGELAEVAGEFLSNISKQPDTYAFYPINDWSDRLLRQTSGLNFGSQIAVLSALGTAESQQRLAELIVAPSTSAEDRLVVAKAFGTSIRRFGTLLSAQAVHQTYDLYNQLGPEDPSIASSLGLVLDFIEAQAGQAAWPGTE